MTRESSRPASRRVAALGTVGRVWIAIALLVMLVAAMSGCGTASAPQGTTTAASTEATAAQPATEPTPAAEATPASPPPAPPAEEKLKIKDIKKGTGAAAKSGVMVTVHYTGWRMDGTKFDSSVDRGQPYSFVLGTGQVIAGWDQGVDGMKVGGVRELIIPPSLAYGAMGTPDGSIAPNATLKFRVEVLSVSAGQ